MKNLALAVFVLLAGCSTPLPEDRARAGMGGASVLKTYGVKYLPGAGIDIDGLPDEPVWQEAMLETDFVFPWRGRDGKPPGTEFRALCDGEFLYFLFTVEDRDVVVDETTAGEKALIAEDRVELYFAPDLELKEYYCVEMDFRGRRLDYRASFHRNFDFSWRFPGIHTAGTRTDRGYIVEGAIPLEALESLGLPSLDSGLLRVGVFRAEFSHGKGSEPLENWISWVDPKTTEEDFHIPGTLGTFRRIR